MNNNAGKWIIRILLLFLFVQFIKYCTEKQEESTQYMKENPPEEAYSAPSTAYRFRLTTLLGKSLKQPATFTVDTKSTDWVLDMNNGDRIVYTILSGSEHDPLCGLKARDSMGDKCEICIRNEPDDAVTVVFEYGKHRYIYKGKFIR